MLMTPDKSSSLKNLIDKPIAVGQPATAPLESGYGREEVEEIPPRASGPHSLTRSSTQSSWMLVSTHEILYIQLGMVDDVLFDFLIDAVSAIRAKASRASIEITRCSGPVGRVMVPLVTIVCA